jgi:hypothetical protein
MLVLSPLATIAVCIYIYKSVQTRGSIFKAGERIPWANVAAVSLAVFLVLYSIGMFSILSTDSSFATCSLIRDGDPSGTGLPELLNTQQELFPVKASCRWADGVTINRVPAFVNPGLTIALCCVALSVLAAIIQATRVQREHVPTR